MLARAERNAFAEPVAAQMAAFMRERAAPIRALVDRASALADHLSARPRPFVPCHADLHAGNLHLTPDDRLYIVDWDTLILAPRERDLMYVSAGVDRVWTAPGAEDAFYAGYGQVEVDAATLAYYRCERAVEDIAAFGQALLLTDEGGADRAQSLRFFMSGFEPRDTVEQALSTKT